MPFLNELDFRVTGPYQRMLTAEFVYNDSRDINWRVPDRYITDGASIPKFAWAFCGGPFSGLYLKPAVVHDYICQFKLAKRSRADRIFLEAMKEEGVNWFKRWYMYRAVRSLSIALGIKGWFFK